MAPQNEEHNGRKNRQTWNVALWVQNDESLYRYALAYKKASKRPSRRGFVQFASLEGRRTPDNIAFDGSRLDYKSLSKMIREL